MRWLAALLLIANVGLYLFYSTNARDRQLLPVATLPPVNEQSMLLKTELPDMRHKASRCYRIGPIQALDVRQGIVDIIEQMHLKYSQVEAKNRNLLYYEILVHDANESEKAYQLMPFRRRQGEAVAHFFNQEQAEQTLDMLNSQAIKAEMRVGQYSLGASQLYWIEVLEVERDFDALKLQQMLDAREIDWMQMPCGF